uniref:Putative conserved plasma membrane protein n=1 Tax=Lutzomyia longipalpis TaxID=7200 RepID=A0A1B0ES74_LUTLO
MPKLRGYDNPVATGTGDEGSAATQGRVKSDAENSADRDTGDHIPTLRRLFNANRYATKKTLAQGILDLALLASNAAQLKYLLRIGDTHEFYTLLLVLIVSSICLQVIQAVVCVVLAMVLNINNVNEQKAADICNNICVAIIIVTVAINVIISAFDLKGDDGISLSWREGWYFPHKTLRRLFNANRYATKKTLAQGILDLALLASNAAQLKYLLRIGDTHEFYTLLLVLIVSSICLQVIQAVVCVVLAMVLNINNVNEQKAADICNNICVAIIIVTVAINVIISAFDLKGDDGISLRYYHQDIQH